MLRAQEPPPNAIWVEELNMGKHGAGLQTSRRRRKRGRQSPAPEGIEYSHGIGHARAFPLTVDLKGNAVRFAAMCGIDDETRGGGAAIFRVVVDDAIRFDSGVSKGNEAPKFRFRSI
jgi:hypothetical protein